MNIDELITLLEEHRDRGVVQVDMQLYDRWSESVRSYPLEEEQLVPHADSDRLVIDAVST